MSEFEVEKGVPVPPSQGGHSGGQRYPWQDMEVDDSFFVPLEDGETVRLVHNRISSVSRMYGKRHGMRFTTRIATEDGVPGVRVWRIE